MSALQPESLISSQTSIFAVEKITIHLPDQIDFYNQFQNNDGPLHEF